MNSAGKIFSSIFKELIIILAVFLTYQIYLEPPEITINSDGIGHYEYLPSIFIHDDFLRKDKPASVDPKMYCRIDNETTGYIIINDYRAIKYPYGMSLLQLPFFIVTMLDYITGHSEITGFEEPFQRSVFYGSLFYLFLTLIFLKHLLKLYRIKSGIIVFIQVLIVFATPVLYYAGEMASYGHIYSLFAITAFYYFTKKIFIDNTKDYIIPAFIMFGLVVILRNFNVLVILGIPFLAGSWFNLKQGGMLLLKSRLQLSLGILIVSFMIFLQLLSYYLQTGDWWIDTYPGESFNFLKPAFFEVLFSYRKGLFIYTPLLLLSVISMITILFKRNFYLSISWFFFFISITYILSSWWWWSNGSSFGQRVYIDHYTIFFIPIAQWINSFKNPTRTLTIIATLLLIPICLIQTYQYKNYILKWDHMTGTDYWRVFLKQDHSLRGYIWQHKLDTTDYLIVDDKYFGDFEVPSDSSLSLKMMFSEEINEWNNVSVIRLELENEFDPNNNCKIIFCIGDVYHLRCDDYSEIPLVHLAQGRFNKVHRGRADFFFKRHIENEPLIIKFRAVSLKTGTVLKNLRIIFFKRKKIQPDYHSIK